jgi:hypothetical protein
VPPDARAAPTRPPISAWLELDGSPATHVIRFHAIAPSRPAKITVRPMLELLTMPSAIVVATSIEINAPAKFSTAESATAAFGLSALVAIDVAMALAVS